ncbi:male sterility protein-related [Canna indica]|uniref:Male sterility protein-related n=1 Tax=Canna indica TaxID=4628 RepID=A0AAQ3KU36_9LILI|nr:male sterility protein-related [Canna indica]
MIFSRINSIVDCRKALSIEEDCNKKCNLAICLMKTGRFEEGKSILQCVKSESLEKWEEASLKSFERASLVLMELELNGNFNEKKDCSMNGELLGGNSSSSWNLMNRNKSQTSIDSKGHNDIRKEELGTASKGGNNYVAINNSSIILDAKKGPIPASSNSASDKTEKNDRAGAYLNFGEKGRALKPKSLNRIWGTETVKTPAKGNGRLPARLGVNCNQQSDAFLNKGMQIDISEEKTPTRSYRKYQYQSNSTYNARDMDRTNVLLTNERTWGDFIEEEELLTQNCGTYVNVTDIALVASEDIKTQLVKKSKRKTWSDMVEEEEQFATEKLGILVGPNDENLIAYKDDLQTQMVQKSKTWSYMVEEYESSNDVSYSHSKPSAKAIESSRDSSAEYFKIPLQLDSGRRSWNDVPERDGSLIDDNSRNVLAVRSNLSIQRTLLFDPEPTSSEQTIEKSEVFSTNYI